MISYVKIKNQRSNLATQNFDVGSIWIHIGL